MELLVPNEDKFPPGAGPEIGAGVWWRDNRRGYGHRHKRIGPKQGRGYFHAGLRIFALTFGFVAKGSLLLKNELPAGGACLP